MGWVLGNLTGLYSLKSTELEEDSKKLKDQLTGVGQVAMVRKLQRDLRKRVFSIRVIIINLINLLVVVLIPLAMLLGPPRLFSWLIPDAVWWTLTTPDMWVFGFIGVIQALIFIEKGAMPFYTGCKALIEARRWLKEQT
jgi:hypothetical protein